MIASFLKVGNIEASGLYEYTIVKLIAFCDIFYFLFRNTSRSVPLYFFFQAEDGIRYRTVTGVQTCALPILPNESERERWLKLPFTGCDGLPKTGEAWVRSGLLAATVFVPPNTGMAIDMLFQAIQNRKPAAERALTVPASIPALDQLKPH